MNGTARCSIKVDSRVALCKRGRRVQGCVDGREYVFYCGCDHLYQWSFERRQTMNTALTCNMTHVVAPQLPSGDMFAAWFRVCKLDYKFSPGECGYVVPGTPSNTKKAINSTNSTQDDVKEENKKAKTVVEGEQEVETAPHTRAVKNLGDAGAGDEAYLLHDKFFSKREGIQPAAITYRLMRGNGCIVRTVPHLGRRVRQNWYNMRSR